MDQLIWQTICHKFCAFQLKTETQNFCRNEYNVTGLCSQQSCPLANSRYATVVLKKGQLFLVEKIVEYSHLPSKVFQHTLLDKNTGKAIEQIEQKLQFHSAFARDKCKLRHQRLIETLKRTRKMTLDTTRPKLVGIKKKLERRDAGRERKAEKMAKLEHSIEKELLNRLKLGVYPKDGVPNAQQESLEQALEQEEEDIEFVADWEMEMEQELEMNLKEDEQLEW